MSITYPEISKLAGEAGIPPLQDDIDELLFHKWLDSVNKLKGTKGKVPVHLQTSFESEMEIYSAQGELIAQDDILRAVKTGNPHATYAKGMAILGKEHDNKRMEVRSKKIDGRRYPTPEECMSSYFEALAEIRKDIEIHFPGSNVLYRGDHLHFSFTDEIKGPFYEILENTLIANWQAARPILCTYEMLTAKPAKEGAYLNELTYRAGEWADPHFIVQRDGFHHYEIRCIFATHDGHPLPSSLHFPNAMLLALALLARSVEYAREACLEQLAGNPARASQIKREADKVTQGKNKEAFGFEKEYEPIGPKNLGTLLNDMRNSEVLKATLEEPLVNLLADKARDYWNEKQLPPPSHVIRLTNRTGIDIPSKGTSL